MAFSTKIRLSWNGMPETYTLAYYEHSNSTAVKSFITLDPVLARKHETR
jgi:hypothetical protein